ncbi:GNAT family N-acetyltransferase [Hassallia byssoidea VB512170]|uniref:GNAT family N-acetyltransferase n=1 Tax=Hassallia byssoidea VB512170 TaxID=1304833 RepID=A0A846H5F4_9CYAN|nr:GNAT family N-acetyltransferase [Hassalia byssoidea]NEU72313.1 GNAT family N-acetyltransferase [Hassalia byssoidea VB512170]
MKVHRYEDASQFYERVKDYLLSQEALHFLLLGISNVLIYNPKRYGEKLYLTTVETDGNIVAVAMRTPPHRLLLSKIQDFAAVEAIAQDLHLIQSLPGVTAPMNEAKAFAEVWKALTGQSYQLIKRLRTFKLEKLQPIYSAQGNLRIATEADKELLLRWYETFSLETVGGIESYPKRWIEHTLQQSTAYIWQDKIPVSIACRGGLTPNGASINMVYTPPEYRKKGYASACVAALSQTLLDKGYKYCFLFTDLANPTSNHIYQAIGYQPVNDWYDYSFIENDSIDVSA